MHEPREGTTAERVAHLRDYWNVVWRGRYTVLAILLVTTALAVLKVVISVPVYRATAVVEIKPEARNVLPGQQSWVGADGRSWIAEELYFNTQLEILRSRELAGRVYNLLPESDRALFQEARDPVGAFAGLVDVRPRANTRLVEVSVSYSDPERTKMWANALADEYVERNVDKAKESFDAIMDEIQGSMEEFRTRIGEAGQRTLQSAADESLYVPDDQRDILIKSLSKYNEELADLQVEMGSLRAELDGYERILREGGDFMSLPRFSQDDVLRELNATKVSLERDLERLATEGKRARHPESLAKSSDLAKVEQKMDEQVQQAALGMQERYRLLRAREANLIQQIRQTERKAYRLEQVASEYELSRTDIESKRRVYDVVAETTEQLSVGAKLILMNNNVVILDRAITPLSPIKPRKALIVGFGLFTGMLLGVVGVLFLDYLDNTIRTPEDIEQSLGINVLAIIPKFRGASANAVREAYQSLRTSILFSSRDIDRRVLLLTSAGPQEGKSSTVKHLAQTLAMSGERVLVLDCDLRRPTAHKHMNVPREPGLTNYLLAGNDTSYRSFVRSTATTNLDVLTCGPVPPNPTDLVGSARFRTLVDSAREDYDWVLVDSPPIASIADTLVLASIVDFLVLVIKHNENDRDLIRRCLKRLRETDVRVAGAVLNSMDMQGGYSYYYTAYDYGDRKGAETGDPDDTIPAGRGAAESANQDKRPVAL